MDEIIDNLLIDNASDIKIIKKDGYIVNDEEEEEGEIRDSHELNDAQDIEELYDNSSSINGYIDNLIKQDGHIFKNNDFDDFILKNIDCFTDINDNLADIDERTLLKNVDNEIKDKYEIRDIPGIIGSDSDSDDDTGSIEEIDLPRQGSILDSLLNSVKKNKVQVEKTKKGRIMDKETELEYLIPVDLEERLSSILLTTSDQLEPVGTVIQRIEGTQTMTMQAFHADPILDIDTVVFDAQKQKIGMIDNIFGTKQNPLYLIICKNVDTWSSFNGGEQIFCAPKVKNAYFTAVETNEIYHDPDSDIAFSDDEKEEEHRRKLAGEAPQKKKQTKRKRKNNNFQQKQQMVPPRNPFRNVNKQPFDARPPMQYWSAPPNPMMAPPGTTISPPMGQYINYPPYQPMFQPFTSYPPPPMMMNPNQCTSYQQFRQQFSSNQSRQ